MPETGFGKALQRDDIRRLNRDYLLLARELFSQDPEMAAKTTGVAPGIGEILANMSIQHIEEVAAQPHLLQFSIRFTEKYWNQVAEAVAADKNSNLSLRFLSTIQSLGGTP